MDAIDRTQPCVVLRRANRRPPRNRLWRPETPEDFRLKHEHEWRLRLLAQEIAQRDPDYGREPHVRRLFGSLVRFFLWQGEWHWSVVGWRSRPRVMVGRDGHERQVNAIKDAARLLHKYPHLRRPVESLEDRAYTSQVS